MNNYVFFLLNSSTFLDSLPVKKNSFYGTYGTRTDNINSKNNTYIQSSLYLDNINERALISS